MPDLITCENASFAYEGQTVLQNLSFGIHQGEYLCIVGENGSGKSTLVKGLLELIAPSGGKIRYGQGFSRAQVGYLPQRSGIRPDFPASVWEVVVSGCREKSPFLSRAMRQQALENLRLVDMEPLRERSIGELSGGQQQRAFLARALCAGRQMLLLDEPVAGLDPVAGREMYAIIDRLHRKEGMTIVMISHDIDMAIASADRILHLSSDGFFLGTPAEYIRSSFACRFMEKEGGPAYV